MSWVIIRRADNQVIFETFSEKVAKAINLDKYKVVPILEHLQNFNKQVKG